MSDDVINAAWRRQVLDKARRLPIFEKIKLFTFEARFNWRGSLSDAEECRAREAVGRVAKCADFFHGGLDGRAVDEFLLPPRITGADPTGAGTDFQPRVMSVYVSTCNHTARAYANRFSNGRVYRVSPEFPIFADPIYVRAAMLCEADEEIAEAISFDDVMTGFYCNRAKVLEVLA